MQRTFRIIVALVVLLAVAAFMMTYTVRFTEAGVVTFFGKADDQSVKREPGLYFKLPYPIQSVVKYDTRTRISDTRSETISTRDSRQVIVQATIAWHVDDPLKFFQSYGNAGSRESDHVRQAEETLRAKLRSALSETSQFAFSDLLSVSAEGSKLPALEQAVLAGVSGAGAGVGASGIKVRQVLITSLELPASVTQTVYQAMEAERKRIAAQAASRGEAESAAIKSSAETDARKIMAFVGRRADAIKGQGDKEASSWLAQQKQDPQLAVFLQNLRFLREALSTKRTTLVLPMSFPGLQLLDPSVIEKLGKGQVPETLPVGVVRPAGAASGGGGQ